jgi:hypothetical protein
MKRLVPIPSRFVDHLKRAEETGIGYQVVLVELLRSEGTRKSLLLLMTWHR